MLALFIYIRTIRNMAVELLPFSFLKSFICVFVLYGLEALLKCDTLCNAFPGFYESCKQNQKDAYSFFVEQACNTVPVVN